jgi:SNF2 family DNA or RNA helicase
MTPASPRSSTRSVGNGLLRRRQLAAIALPQRRDDRELPARARRSRDPHAARQPAIADDVGLGKTIEAGLVLQELLLRHRIQNVLVCPASLNTKWKDEMRDKFGLDFVIVDSDAMKRLRRERGLHVSPWTHFPRLITSMDYLKREMPAAVP